MEGSNKARCSKVSSAHMFIEAVSAPFASEPRNITRRCRASVTFLYSYWTYWPPSIISFCRPLKDLSPNLAERFAQRIGELSRDAQVIWNFLSPQTHVAITPNPSLFRTLCWQMKERKKSLLDDRYTALSPLKHRQTQSPNLSPQPQCIMFCS